MSRRFKAAIWIAFSISLLVWAFLFIRWRMGHETPHHVRLRKNMCYAFMGQMEQAMSMYRIDHGEYPSPEAGGLALLTTKSARSGAYFEFESSQKDSLGRILDPWGHPYIYRLQRETKNRTRYFLRSVGPNGVDDGGVGDDLSHDD